MLRKHWAILGLGVMVLGVATYNAIFPNPEPVESASEANARAKEILDKSAKKTGWYSLPPKSWQNGKALFIPSQTWSELSFDDVKAVQQFASDQQLNSIVIGDLEGSEANPKFTPNRKVWP